MKSRQGQPPATLPPGVNMELWDETKVMKRWGGYRLTDDADSVAPLLREAGQEVIKQKTKTDNFKKPGKCQIYV